MKKIVSAALVASLVAGAAFAADAKISLNHRTKLDAYSYVSKETGDNKASTTEWMDWEGYDGAGAQAATSCADSFKFVLDGDNAGVTLNINATNDTKAFAVLNQYSAWAKWALPAGSLKIEAGNWKDGYADGAYRVKKDVDAWGAEGMDFERFKLGTILYGSNSSFVDDLTSGKGQTAESGFATYSVNATDDIDLNVTLGGTYKVFDKVADTDDATDTSTEYYDSTFVGRLQLNMKDAFKSELIFKKVAPRYNVFALFVKPQVLDGLDMTIGGTVETYNKKDADYTALAFDFRARYQVNDQLSITTFNNYSSIDTDAGLAISAGLVGHKGAEGYCLGKDATVKVKSAMWNELEARYKVSDLLTIMGSVGLITPLENAKDDDNDYGIEWRVTPAVQIYANSNAYVYTGVALSGTSTTVSDVDNSVFAVQVPVVFRVKM